MINQDTLVNINSFKSILSIALGYPMRVLLHLGFQLHFCVNTWSKIKAFLFELTTELQQKFILL